MNNDSIGEELKAFFEVYALDADGYQHENGHFDQVQVIAHDDLQGLLLRRKDTFYRLTIEKVDLPREDYGQSGEQLSAYYSPHGDGEHPILGKRQWTSDVVSGLTEMGYWEWLERRLWEAMNTVDIA